MRRVGIERLGISMAVAGGLLLAPAAWAGHFDIFLANDGGQVGVAGFDFDDGMIEEARIFEAEMELDAGVFIADEPGIVSGDPDPAGMPAGWLPLQQSPALDVGFNIATTLGYNLLFWDGVGSSVNDVTLGPVPDGEVLQVLQTGCFTCASVLADGGTGSVVGFTIDNTATTVHEHPEFLLFGDASATPDTPTEGVYVLTWEMTVSGLANSSPLWIVFGAFDPDSFPGLDPEEFDEFLEGRIELAADYIALNVIPEPGTVLLLASGLAGLALRGRRPV